MNIYLIIQKLIVISTILNYYFITDKLSFYIRVIAVGDFRLYKSAIERLKGVKILYIILYKLVIFI